MKQKIALYSFSAGLLLLTVQFLVIIFGFINNDLGATDEPFALVEEQSFFDVIGTIWSGLAGVLLLIVMYVRRFVKGPDSLMMLVGIMLWVIQILTLRDEGMEVSALLIKYILGIIGLALVVVATIVDMYLTKNMSSAKNKKDD